MGVQTQDDVWWEEVTKTKAVSLLRDFLNFSQRAYIKTREIYSRSFALNQR